nr:uncharacterized protein LOC129267954 [Lytechinus pictus]
MDSNVDIMFLTETWLRSDDPVVIGECTPAGYAFLNVARGGNDAHGGLAVIYKTGLKLSSVNISSSHDTFELAAVLDPSSSVCYVVIYRPPPSAKNGFRTQDFLLEFEELVCELTTHTWKLLILGDFNMHVDTPKPDVSCFLEIIAQAGLQQHITTPTHKHGHVLDLVISRMDDPLVAECEVLNKLYSDHYVLSCVIDVAKQQRCASTSLRRNFRDLDKDSFHISLREAFHDFPFESDVNTQVEFYKRTILDVLNQHCPASKYVHRFRPHPPWYTDEVHQARRTRRKMERRWRKLRTPESRQLYLSAVHDVCNLIHRQKSQYYTDQLCSADVKNVFRVLNTLLNRSPTILPADTSATSLPDRFASFFIQKVERIRSDLHAGNAASQVCASASHEDGAASQLKDFDDVTAERVYKFIRSAPNKSCSLDPLLTWLLKENINTLLPYIVSIINTSLDSGLFPVALREALVTPLIKKSNLDRDNLKTTDPSPMFHFFPKSLRGLLFPNLGLS